VAKNNRTALAKSPTTKAGNKPASKPAASTKQAGDANKSALTTSPSSKDKTKQKTPQELGLKNAGKGLFRNRKGELTNGRGDPVDKNGKVLKTKNPKKETAPEAPPAPTGAEFATPFNQQSPEQQVGNVNTEVGESAMGYLQQLQQQGGFNPGEYQDVYNQAYQNVMGQFELQNRDAFNQQSQQIEQAIAERGIDPTGRQAQNLRDQMFKQQDQARQQSMYQAENMGRQLQQQRFEQDLTKYQVPSQMLGALQGYFGGQLGSVEAQRQRDFEAQQAELQRQASKDVARIGGGGGGKTDPFALMEAEYKYKRDLLFDQAALSGQGNKAPSQWNAAASGFATGIGAGIGRGIAGG